VRSQFLRTGKFNATSDGAVLPRYVEAGRPRATAEALDEVFHTVRVSASTWLRSTQINLLAPTNQRHDVTVPADGVVKVAQIPFAAPGEIRMAHDTTVAGVDVYTSTPDAALEGRVAKAMKAIRNSNAQIALVPEATLTDAILTKWQAACSPGGPDWILVGTGNLTGVHPGASAPAPVVVTKAGLTVGPNRAVLLDGRTGHVIAAQDKRHGFTILPDFRAAYGMGSAPEAILDEAMIQGKKLTVIESRIGRVAILVCEDLDHLTQDGAMLRELGVSLVLAPIVAPPIVAYRWQHQASNSLAKDIGSTVITFNSVALGRDEEQVDPSTGATMKKPATTLMVVAPVPNEYRTDVQAVLNPLRGTQGPKTDAVTVRASNLKTP
jgi:predicted amidohydrolase